MQQHQTDPIIGGGEFSFTGVSRIKLRKKENGRPVMISTDIFLSLSDNLDKSAYTDAGGLPWGEAGIKAVTQSFLQGLITNVKLADQRGWITRTDHVEYILHEFNRSLNSGEETIVAADF